MQNLYRPLEIIIFFWPSSQKSQFYGTICYSNNEYVCSLGGRKVRDLKKEEISKNKGCRWIIFLQAVTLRKKTSENGTAEGNHV